jgi:hypothetical protein
VSNYIEDMNIPGLVVPEGARALLVDPIEGDIFRVQAVEFGDSVLNIERDLFLHLNEYPHSAEFLTELRDYCTARLEARAQARQTGSVTMPGASRNEWRFVRAGA